MEISIEFIKSLGWYEQNNTYIKVPYPFSLTWDHSESIFCVVDLFFPDLIESDVFLRTQTDYYTETNLPETGTSVLASIREGNNYYSEFLILEKDVSWNYQNGNKPEDNKRVVGWMDGPQTFIG